MQTGDLTPTFFATPAEFRRWLIEHHASESELWVGFYKKVTGRPTITYAEAVDEALCFGWIDGLKNKHDEFSYKLRFTPRKSRSIWSKVNVANAERLIKTGQMMPAGLAQVEAAKADGRWTAAYDSGRTMTVPGDFQTALDQNPAAKAFYESLNKTNTYAILWRIQTAAKPETRAARIAKLISMLEAGQKLH